MSKIFNPAFIKAISNLRAFDINGLNKIVDEFGNGDDNFTLKVIELVVDYRNKQSDEFEKDFNAGDTVQDGINKAFDNLKDL